MSHVEFTKEMKKTHTILVPMMLPIHFQFLRNILCKEGYRVEILKTEGQQIIDEGLKNVHNDTCYPALLVIGQMIDALKSGKYDTAHIALAITGLPTTSIFCARHWFRPDLSMFRLFLSIFPSWKRTAASS